MTRKQRAVREDQRNVLHDRSTGIKCATERENRKCSCFTEEESIGPIVVSVVTSAPLRVAKHTVAFLRFEHA